MRSNPIALRPTGRRGFLGVSAMALLLASCATPTLPLPPPMVSAISAPENGLVRVEGQGLPDAWIMCVNNDTEEGIIGRSDASGEFAFEIRAESGHYLTVWQRVATDIGPGLDLVVP